jgi:hypothetical protein
MPVVVVAVFVALPVQEDQIAVILQQALQGLQYLHGQMHIHRWVALLVLQCPCAGAMVSSGRGAMHCGVCVTGT